MNLYLKPNTFYEIDDYPETKKNKSNKNMNLITNYFTPNMVSNKNSNININYFAIDMSKSANTTYNDKEEYSNLLEVNISQLYNLEIISGD